MKKSLSAARFKNLRVFLALFLIFGLWILPLNVAAQKRRASTNPSKSEKTKASSVENRKSEKEAAKKTLAVKKQLKKQSADEYTQGVLWQGEPGVTKTVSRIMEDEAAYQASLTPQDRAELEQKHKQRNEENEFRLDKDQKDSPAPLLYDVNGGYVNPLERQPVIKKSPNRLDGRLNPQTIPLTFSGPDASVGGGFVPPDTQGDVGPTDVLMTANDRITSYTKAGVIGSLNSSTTTFWASTGATGPCDNHVRYDRLSQRWFVAAIDCDPAGSNKILIAVSSGPTITGAGSFTFFNFVHDAVGTTPNTDTGAFADYPTLGVDKNALYIGDNVFPAGGFTGCSAFVINKANLLAGTLTVTVFRNIGTSTTGIYTPQGVDNEDPSATVGYFVGSDTGVYNVLNIHKITNPGGVPSISGAMTVAVSTGKGKNVPSAGGSLDPLDDRPFAAMINVNRVLTSARQDVASLWTAQSFSMERTAPFGPATAAPARMGGRWYEINTDIAAPALRQSGTFINTTGTTAATAIHTWITTTAMSGQGFMAVGSSNGGTPIFPGTVVAGRLREDSPSSADALGVTEMTTTAFAGQLAYANDTGSARRWGDYSQTVVDPNDDQTIWTFQEYSDNLGNWHERAVKLQAPPPAAPASSTPASCLQADMTGNFHGVVTVTGTSTAGSEFYDGNVVDWKGFRDYANYADNTGSPVAYTHGGGPGFQGPGAINAVGNGHLTANGGAATTGAGTASVAAFAPNAPGNSTIYLSPTTFKIKLDITGATSGSKYPLTVVNPDGQSVTTNNAVCVYIPTAASTNLSGRVTTKDGRGIGGVVITLQSAASGQAFSVRTNSFGYYNFNEIAAGQSYVVSANAKGYSFPNASQVVNLTGDNTSVNFTANNR